MKKVNQLADPQLHKTNETVQKKPKNGKPTEINVKDSLVQRSILDQAKNGTKDQPIQKKAVSKEAQPNYTALAKQVYDAIDGLGTDEKAVYEALKKLDRDFHKILQLKVTYKNLYKSDLIEDIKGDFSGAELDEALGYLKSNDNDLKIKPTGGNNGTAAMGELKDNIRDDAAEKMGEKILSSESKIAKTNLAKTAGKALSHVGAFMDLVSLAHIMMGKEELYKGLDVIVPLSFLMEDKFREIDDIHIEVALKQGYSHTKTLLENSRTIPAKMVYVNEKELAKINNGEIKSFSQLSQPYNESLPFALLIDKGKEWRVYGGFYLGK